MINFSIEVIGIIEDNQDDNIDVFVKFDNGEEYVGTFFTYKNIEWLIKKNKRTGELLGGKYFWASDMILIETLELTNINNVVKDLLLDGCFYHAFSPANKKALNRRKDHNKPKDD